MAEHAGPGSRSAAVAAPDPATVLDAPMLDAPMLDAVVVGAGPAGAAAAIELARAGHSVALVERGPFAGSKNVYGGVVYGRVLDELVPHWWEQAPMQRWVTRRSTMILDGERSLAVDYRTAGWGRPPYNGATAYRPDFDAWLAGVAEQAGALLVPSTVVTGLLRGPDGRIAGVRTDRADGDLPARVVIACDGVNSFLAKEAGMLDAAHQAEHTTLGVKETLGLDRSTLEERFGLTGREGLDIEMLGCTRGIPGGGFLYTNLESVSIGVVLGLPGLAASGLRPEEVIADLKAHPSVAPWLRGAELVEYSAHLIPEGGYDTMPELVGDGMLVAGDAAAMCLAAGIWLEGVNFAIGSGMYAGRAASAALRAGDTSRAGLAGYRTMLDESFVLADHRKLRKAPGLILGERMQQRYPKLVCDIVEGMFQVDNPRPKPGLRKLAQAGAKRHGVRLRDLARDAAAAIRSFG